MCVLCLCEHARVHCLAHITTYACARTRVYRRHSYQLGASVPLGVSSKDVCNAVLHVRKLTLSIAHLFVIIIAGTFVQLVAVCL